MAEIKEEGQAKKIINSNGYWIMNILTVGFNNEI